MEVKETVLFLNCIVELVRSGIISMTRPDSLFLLTNLCVCLKTKIEDRFMFYCSRARNCSVFGYVLLFYTRKRFKDEDFASIMLSWIKSSKFFKCTVLLVLKVPRTLLQHVGKS